MQDGVLELIRYFFGADGKQGKRDKEKGVSTLASSCMHHPKEGYVQQRQDVCVCVFFRSEKDIKAMKKKEDKEMIRLRRFITLDANPAIRIVSNANPAIRMIHTQEPALPERLTNRFVSNLLCAPKKLLAGRTCSENELPKIHRRVVGFGELIKKVKFCEP